MLYTLLLLPVALVLSKTYFHEVFDEGFEKRWVYSEDTSVTHGVFNRVQRQHCSEGEFAIKSQNDSSYYHISAKLDDVLDLTKKPLFLQYVAQYEQGIDCGGAYIKLFDKLDQKTLLGTSPYSIMFGPDACGTGTKVVHCILSHKGTNYASKSTESFETDTKPHLFELFIGLDKKFHIKVDGVVKKEGLLEDNFDYLPPKIIDDPKSKKPEDWVDEDTIVDPESKKPEDWDERKHIPDENAVKPEDWDDEKDGEWERDMIENPNYKGDWEPKRIPNPAYKGEWKPAQIDNPDYKPDNTFANFKLQYVGFDLWTVKSGTVFDDIFITDDKSEAETHAKKVLALIATQSKAIEEAEKVAAESEKPPTVEDDSGEVDEGKDEAEEKEDDEEDREDL